MRKKQAIVAVLGLIIAVFALLVLWPSLRAKSPESPRQEPSAQTSGPPAPRAQPSQGETAPAELGKRAEVPEERVGDRAIRADDEATPFSSGSWVMEQQRIGPNGLMKESSISKVWMKGDRKRVETFRTLGAWSGTALQPTTIVFSDSDYDYAYYPSEKRMVKFPHALSLEVLDKKWTRKKSEVKVGSEVVDGKLCQTYRVINDMNVAGLATVTMEVRESRWQGMVLKSVSKPMKSKTGDTLVTQLKEICLDIPIPDEKFTLPTGVKIEEVKIPREMQKAFR